MSPARMLLRSMFLNSTRARMSPIEEIFWRPLAPSAFLDRTFKKLDFEDAFNFRKQDEFKIDDSNGFKMSIDVSQYKPEEISVRVSGIKTVTVEAEHNGEESAEGFLTRRLTQRFVIPDGHDMEKLKSELSNEGILHVSAPRIETDKDIREIPIQINESSGENKNDK